MVQPGTSSSPSGIRDAELGDEKALGGNPAAAAANAALRALSRAARAFALYEPKNEAIRRFLGEFQEKTFKALEVCGELPLEVKPFELHFQGQPVYAETDREKSLAFRLFRDGVRRLTLKPGLTWEELLRLLELLSVRFTGVRQQEDDLVTLLTRAHFAGLDFEAVEGFVAHDEDEAGPDDAGAEVAPPGMAPQGPARAVPHVAAPPGFDLPLPPPAQPLSYGYREVPAQYLEPLRAEEAADAVPVHALRLLAELRAAPGVTPDEVTQLAHEVKDFLLADRRLRALFELVRVLQAGPPPLVEALKKTVESLGTAETLARLLECVPEDAAAAPPELVQLLERVPGDHLAHLLDALALPGQRRGAVLETLLASRAKANPDAVLMRLKTSTPEVGGRLLALLVAVEPQRGLDAATALSHSRDPALQQQVLGVVERAPPHAPQATQLLQAVLQSDDEAVRVRALGLAAARREGRLFDAVAKGAEARAAKGLSAREAEAVGEALAALVPATALPLLKGWAHPKKGLAGRLSPQAKALALAAAAGLGALPGAEAEAAIRELMAQGDEELKAHCVQAMQKRRRAAAGAKPHG